MSETTTTVRDGSVPFPSLTALRAAHVDLLKRYRDSNAVPEILADITALIRDGRATGALLNDTEERWTAQNLLDYWATTLYQREQDPPDTTLVDFDPLLAPELPDDICPYVGLDAFLERDYDRFFGRQYMVADLLEHIKTHRMLAIIGPSGSGKSSLALAGLLAALRRDVLPGSKLWRYYPRVVPGSDPLANLARILYPSLHRGGQEILETWIQQQIALFRADPNHLARLLNRGSDTPAVLVIDQFEEVFTLCDDVQTQRLFIANLLNLILLPGSRHRIILTMRSDFESYVQQIPKLEKLVRRATVRALPLNAGELREAIERPAELVGLKFEAGVVDALIQDILGEPAALPLLQFTLLKLWQRRERNWVSWDSYRRLGGGRQALARSADAFYESLIPEEQVTLRRILLRMVRPGEGLEVTSNRIRRESLYQGGEASDRIDRVLDKLIAERLIRVTEGATPADTQIEVAHEALVRNWPRLVEWLGDEREELRQRQRLTREALDWNASGRDRTMLLGETRALDARRYKDLSKLEREYVRMSLYAIELEKEKEATARREKEAAQQRELQQQLLLAVEQQRRAEAEIQRTLVERERLIEVQRRTEAEQQSETERLRAEEQARSGRRLQWLVIALGMVLILVITSVVFALYQWRRAEANARVLQFRSALLAAQKPGLPAVRLVWAVNLAQVPDVPESIKDEYERTIDELLQQAKEEYRSFISISPAGSDESDPSVAASVTSIIRAAAMSPDRRFIASASANGILRVWRVDSGSLFAQLAASDESFTSVAWSPGGKRLLTGSQEGQLRIWDLDRQEPILSLDLKTPITSVAWNPNGKHLLVGSKNSTAQILSASDGHSLEPQLAHSGSINTVAWSPDGRFALTASDDGDAGIWEVTDQLIHPLTRISGESGSVTNAATNAAWSPDGKSILIGHNDGTALVVSFDPSNPSNRSVRTLQGTGSAIQSVAWSPDGRYIATGSSDKTARIWQTIGAEAIFNLRELRGNDAAVVAIGWVGHPGDWHVLTASDLEIHRYRFGNPQAVLAEVAPLAEALQKDPAMQLVRNNPLVAAGLPTSVLAQTPGVQTVIATPAVHPTVAQLPTDVLAVLTSDAEGTTIASVATPAPTETPVPTATPAPPTDAPISPPDTPVPPTDAPILPSNTTAPLFSTNTPAPLFPTNTSVPPQIGPLVVTGASPSLNTLSQTLGQAYDSTGGTWGVLLIDSTNDLKVLYNYQQNDTRSFYAASLIKLPIAITVYALAAQGEISLDDTITLKQSDIVAGTGSTQGEQVGRPYTLRELCRRMLRDSDNTASNMVLGQIGFDRVNQLMQRIGATQTKVERLFFDQAAADAGRDIRTSPRDMALLLRTLNDQQIAGIPFPQLAELADAMADSQDREKIRRDLPPGAIVRNKSGIVSRTVHDSAIIDTPNGRRYIVVIMSEDVADQTAIDTIARTSRMIYDYEVGLR
jgi:beta-lactamase class A